MHKEVEAFCIHLRILRIIESTHMLVVVWCQAWHRKCFDFQGEFVSTLPFGNSQQKKSYPWVWNISQLLHSRDSAWSLAGDCRQLEHGCLRKLCLALPKRDMTWDETSLSCSQLFHLISPRKGSSSAASCFIQRKSHQWIATNLSEPLLRHPGQQTWRTP